MLVCCFAVQSSRFDRTAWRGPLPVWLECRTGWGRRAAGIVLCAGAGSEGRRRPWAWRLGVGRDPCDRIRCGRGALLTRVEGTGGLAAHVRTWLGRWAGTLPGVSPDKKTGSEGCPVGSAVLTGGGASGRQVKVAKTALGWPLAGPGLSGREGCGVGPPSRGPSRRRTATWLILPVVIRSSQRLSHASLSINPLL